MVRFKLIVFAVLLTLSIKTNAAGNPGDNGIRNVKGPGKTKTEKIVHNPELTKNRKEKVDDGVTINNQGLLSEKKGAGMNMNQDSGRSLSPEELSKGWSLHQIKNQQNENEQADIYTAGVTDENSSSPGSTQLSGSEGKDTEGKPQLAEKNEIVTIVNKYLELWGNHDSESMAELLHPEVGTKDQVAEKIESTFQNNYPDNTEIIYAPFISYDPDAALVLTKNHIIHVSGEKNIEYAWLIFFLKRFNSEWFITVQNSFTSFPPKTLSLEKPLKKRKRILEKVKQAADYIKTNDSQSLFMLSIQPTNVSFEDWVKEKGDILTPIMGNFSEPFFYTYPMQPDKSDFKTFTCKVIPSKEINGVNLELLLTLQKGVDNKFGVLDFSINEGNTHNSYVETANQFSKFIETISKVIQTKEIYKFLSHTTEKIHKSPNSFEHLSHLLGILGNNSIPLIEFLKPAEYALYDRDSGLITIFVETVNLLGEKKSYLMFFHAIRQNNIWKINSFDYENV